MRITVGIVAGVITAALWFLVITAIGQSLLLEPEGETALIQIPMGRVAIVVGWFGAALGGGIVANAVAQHWWLAVIIAGIVIAAASAMTLMTPNPTWLSLAGVAAPLVAAEIANRATRAWTR